MGENLSEQNIIFFIPVLTSQDLVWLFPCSQMQCVLLAFLERHSESDQSESLLPQDTDLDHDFVNNQDIDGDQDLLTSVDQDQYLNSLAFFFT